MAELIIRYAVLSALVIGVFYLVYILKEKNSDLNEDYYGIARTILSSLSLSDISSDDVKKILRVVSDVVNFIEVKYKDSSNKEKENKALVMILDALEPLGFSNKIDEISIRELIRLACGFLNYTKKSLVTGWFLSPFWYFYN